MGGELVGTKIDILVLTTMTVASWNDKFLFLSKWAVSGKIIKLGFFGEYFFIYNNNNYNLLYR